MATGKKPSGDDPIINLKSAAYMFPLRFGIVPTWYNLPLWLTELQLLFPISACTTTHGWHTSGVCIDLKTYWRTLKLPKPFLVVHILFHQITGEIIEGTAQRKHEWEALLLWNNYFLLLELRVLYVAACYHCMKQQKMWPSRNKISMYSSSPAQWSDHSDAQCSWMHAALSHEW